MHGCFIVAVIIYYLLRVLISLFLMSVHILFHFVRCEEISEQLFLLFFILETIDTGSWLTLTCMPHPWLFLDQVVYVECFSLVPLVDSG